MMIGPMDYRWNVLRSIFIAFNWKKCTPLPPRRVRPYMVNTSNLHTLIYINPRLVFFLLAWEKHLGRFWTKIATSRKFSERNPHHLENLTWRLSNPEFFRSKVTPQGRFSGFFSFNPATHAILVRPVLHPWDQDSRESWIVSVETGVRHESLRSERSGESSIYKHSRRFDWWTGPARPWRFLNANFKPLKLAGPEFNHINSFNPKLRLIKARKARSIRPARLASISVLATYTKKVVFGF